MTRLFTLPHTLIGLVAICYLIYLLAFALFNQRTTATLVNVDVGKGSKGTNYTLHYKYKANGGTYIDSKSVSKEFYDSLTLAPESSAGPETYFKSRPVEVRHLDIGPFHRSEIETRGMWLGILFLLAWATFWNSCMASVWRDWWIKPLRQRYILRNGAVTKGHITGKDPVKFNKSDDHLGAIHFLFINPADGKYVKGSSWCLRDKAYQTAHPRDQITVIYSPQNPRRALALEHCLYEIKENHGNNKK